MPRLIHLNGPPGIGKSSLARRYAHEHPGVLDLDLDALRGLLPGLRFIEVGPVVRPLGHALASAHLREGRDVVLPQYLGRLEEIEGFASTASVAGSDFVEVMLTDSRAGAVARFARRGADGTDPWHDEVRAVVAAQGGEEHLGWMHDRLQEMLAARPSYVVVDSVEGEPEAAYDALLRTLRGG